MTDPARDSLITFWDRVRDSVLALAQHTWARLAEDEDDLWASGRDLTEEEGVGFQAQYTYPGPFANERLTEVRIVAQWEISRGQTGLFWVIEAMPALMMADGERRFLHCYRWRVPYRHWKTATEVTLEQVVPAVRQMLNDLKTSAQLPAEHWIGNTQGVSVARQELNNDGDRRDQPKPPNIR